MMQHLSLLFLFLFTIQATAQEKLRKDLDLDGIEDVVYFDLNDGIIICELSTQKFIPIHSQPMETYGNEVQIYEAKNGFYININWMRTGYSNQFRYNKKTKNIQLIGMSRYEFGNAANDGSGESSVNLLTGDYNGNWNYYDHSANDETGELIKIPTIKSKMHYGVINLIDFSDETFFDFSEKCANLFYKAKERMQQR